MPLTKPEQLLINSPLLHLTVLPSLSSPKSIGMAETKGAKQIAMSRALGAAFLNHQVEQLEKSVNGRGPSSGNWRDRKQGPRSDSPSYAPPKRGPRPTNNNSSRKRDGEFQSLSKDPRDSRDSKDRDSRRNIDQGSRRRSVANPSASDREGMERQREKDADIVVVDASVLLHALNYLKKWCKNGREEVVIVPLEALNTLDLLKKGQSGLAQRARAASRILEAQVGTNPRIRVQRDEAFVLWDAIDFAADTTEDKSSVSASPSTNTPAYGSPEWVRRTICCARWEVDSAANPSEAMPDVKEKPKVILAVCTTVTSSPSTPLAKLPPDADAAPLTPVPLPAPVQHPANKHEPRTTGTHVGYWGAKAGIHVFDVKPSGPNTNGSPAVNGSHAYPRSSSEEDRDTRDRDRHERDRGDRPKRILTNNKSGGGRRPNTSEGDKLKGGLVERSPAVLAMMEMVQRPDSKAVRVLARGEKLDPDT